MGNIIDKLNRVNVITTTFKQNVVGDEITNISLSSAVEQFIQAQQDIKQALYEKNVDPNVPLSGIAEQIQRIETGGGSASGDTYIFVPSTQLFKCVNVDDGGAIPSAWNIQVSNIQVNQGSTPAGLNSVYDMVNKYQTGINRSWVNSPYVIDFDSSNNRWVIRENDNVIAAASAEGVSTQDGSVANPIFWDGQEVQQDQNRMNTNEFTMYFTQTDSYDEEKHGYADLTFYVRLSAGVEYKFGGKFQSQQYEYLYLYDSQNNQVAYGQYNPYDDEYDWDMIYHDSDFINAVVEAYPEAAEYADDPEGNWEQWNGYATSYIDNYLNNKTINNVNYDVTFTYTPQTTGLFKLKLHNDSAYVYGDQSYTQTGECGISPAPLLSEAPPVQPWLFNTWTIIDTTNYNPSYNPILSSNLYQGRSATGIKLWSGNQCILSGNTYIFDSKITNNLPWSSVRPVIGNIYTADGLMQIDYIYTRSEEGPLTFTATQNGSSVKLRMIGGDGNSWLNQKDLYYRKGKSGEWIKYPSMEYTINLNEGQCVQFWNKNNLWNNSNNSARFELEGTIKASGDIQSLLNYVDYVPEWGFNNAFYYQENLIQAPALTAIRIGQSGYSSMFSECHSLKRVFKFEAQTITTQSCFRMFYQCSSLQQFPQIKITRMNGKNACAQMFSYCNSLKRISNLPCRKLTQYCYSNMFAYCSSLQETPELPAINGAPNCYEQMFIQCTNLKKVNKIYMQNFGYCCLKQMFYNCTSLTTVQPINIVSFNVSYNGTITNCFDYTFQNCNSLTGITINMNPKIKQLPNTAFYCTFQNCSSLSSINMDLSNIQRFESDSCRNMFAGCQSIIQCPISFTTAYVKDYSFQNMFSGCSNMTTCPSSLTFTFTGDGWYAAAYMFSGTKITTPPQLNFNSFPNTSCQGMFKNCSQLTAIPLIDTGWMDTCNEMFMNCTSLSSVYIKIDEKGSTCANDMFNGCTNLKSISAILPDWNGFSNWVANVGLNGTFYKSSNLSQEYGDSYIPNGWTVYDLD